MLSWKSAGRATAIADRAPLARPQPLRAVLDGGVELAVDLRRSARARRLSLRIGPSGAVVLTVPARCPAREMHRFLDAQRTWLSRHLARVPAPVPFAPGAAVPLRGTPHALIHVAGARRVVWVEAGSICVSGAAAHFGRRVGDWLRREARADLAARCHAHAATLGRDIARIGVRDTVSRWGSCSSTGALSFSWRLVLAPPAVLDYVAAHEVSHLAEPHHGPAFWSVVRTLCPDFAGARDWLRREGAALHRYGA